MHEIKKKSSGFKLEPAIEHYISDNSASGPNSKGETCPLVKFITLIAAFGGLLFGYDTGVISGALFFMARRAAEGGKESLIPCATLL